MPGLNEVFTWGDNANYTLGHKNIQRKFVVPELLSSFGKLPVSIQQVNFSLLNCCNDICNEMLFFLDFLKIPLSV